MARRPSGHPGFQAVSHSIAQRENVSEDRADAILAASSRRASAAAKRKNPRLNRVKGKAKRKSKSGPYDYMSR